MKKEMKTATPWDEKLQIQESQIKKKRMTWFQQILYQIKLDS